MKTRESDYWEDISNFDDLIDEYNNVMENEILGYYDEEID